MCLPSGYRQVMRTADCWNNEETVEFGVPKLLETRTSAAVVGNGLERVVLMVSLGQPVHKHS